ncbi:MAG TPA: choice-of-anchor D domain-containing protein [Xanthomonadaceae bacterium]|nr:choice-of-anchor D domain-containing protein [Xanthomonadaceae bacterium]
MRKNPVLRQLMLSGSMCLGALSGYADGAHAACVSVGGSSYQCADAEISNRAVSDASAAVSTHPGISGDTSPGESGLMVGPAEPQIELSASSLDFGAQPLGVPSPPQTVTVVSVGAVDLQLGVLEVVGLNAENFAIQIDDCSLATLSPTQACEVSIHYTPLGYSFHQAELQLPSNAPTNPDTVTLMGRNAHVFADGFESPTPLERVIEALQAVAVVRLWFAEYWLSLGVIPETMAELGFDDPYPAGSAWATLEDGLIVLTFEGALEGQTLALAPWELLDQLGWSCGYAEPPKDAVLLSGTTSAARTTVDPVHLPEPCTQP